MANSKTSTLIPKEADEESRALEATVRKSPTARECHVEVLSLSRYLKRIGRTLWQISYIPGISQTARFEGTVHKTALTSDAPCMSGVSQNRPQVCWFVSRTHRIH